jgi:two-component system phosphate regulon sensor histidine kinase PhoR
MTDLWLGLFLSALALLAWCGVRLRRLARDRELAVRAGAAAVADRVAMRQQTVEAQAHLNGLGATDPDALLLLDADRRILWGNPNAWTLFGCGTPPVGQPFIVLAGDAELNQAVQDALAGGRTVVRQAAVGGRTLRMSVAPIAVTGGAAASISDVTEMQRLGRARRDLVANISHELRTPLANINLAAETLRDGAGMADAMRGRLLDQIESQVQALSQLSQEMLDLAQIESGQVMLRLVPVELATLVRQALAQLAPQAAVKRQRLSVLVSPNLTALADVQQATRVIGNLVHNAVKFTPEGGSICIEAEPVGEDALLRVTDSGPGIPQAERSRIFERFYKADRARTKGGTGLGLAIARHIVEGHGGRIWVECAPGGGAQFCFTLPRA